MPCLGCCALHGSQLRYHLLQGSSWTLPRLPSHPSSPLLPFRTLSRSLLSQHLSASPVDCQSRGGSNPSVLIAVSPAPRAVLRRWLGAQISFSRVNWTVKGTLATILEDLISRRSRWYYFSPFVDEAQSGWINYSNLYRAGDSHSSLVTILTPKTNLCAQSQHLH